MDLKQFLELDNGSIYDIIKERNKPKNVALMIDGTRRMLKLEPERYEGGWLYDLDHIKKLMYKSVETVDMLFNLGINTVMGPLASIGNLKREQFMPQGLNHLLDPLFDEFSVSVIKKHNASVFLYGDLGYVRSLNGGEMIDDYITRFSEISSKNPEKHVAIGIGFSTNHETKLIANNAIDFYKRENREPLFEELVFEHFGFNAEPIDIFIRTNEIKSSGGLTPLLTSPDTQFYFPVSPGIISISEYTLKLILHDYLFNRSLSHGMHEHSPISDLDAEKVKDFYIESKNNVIGVGKRVSDIWIND